MGKLAFKEAQVARGRLSFAYAQVFGMSGKLALQQISQHAYRKPFVLQAAEKLVTSLLFLRSRLASREPRVINSNLEGFSLFSLMQVCIMIAVEVLEESS